MARDPRYDVLFEPVRFGPVTAKKLRPILYTVADRAGRILATEVDAETLYERLPEVSVQTLQLQAGAPGPLMMVDPDSVQH